MLARNALLSRNTIVILSFVLVQTGLARYANPPLAMMGVLAGTAGLVAYVGVKWSAFVRNRQQIVTMLCDLGHMPP